MSFISPVRKGVLDTPHPMTLGTLPSVWWDFANHATGDIPTLNDSSKNANNLTQGTSTARPSIDGTLNGHNIATFDGGDFLDIGASPVGATTYTMFFMFRILSDVTSRQTLIELFDASIPGGRRTCFYYDSGELYFNGWGGGAQNWKIYLDLTANTSYVFAFRRIGNVLKSWLNATTPVGRSDMGLGTTIATQRWIGKNRDGAFFLSSMGEIIIYTEALPDHQVVWNMRYLGNKWGVTV